jgi:hypothetical protein
VPVLLHDGSDALPAATVGALTTLPIDHVIVLGGPARIPPDVVTAVQALTGAAVERISGPDRYATSVEMARRLGGWWPTGRADEYAASMVCLAASSGSGANGSGWPDALAAGPWCAAASGAAAGRGAPVRALGPVTGGRPVATASPSLRPNHDAVPVLLVPAGASTLPASVDDLLSAAFEPDDTFCSSVQALPGCVIPGFVIAAGGSTVLPSALVAQAASVVAGGAPTAGSAAPPPLDTPFLTSLDLAPVFATASGAPNAVCVGRDGYRDTRWLTVRAGGSAVLGQTDVMLGGRYVSDADGVVRTPGVGSPACVTTTSLATALRARSVGLAGRVGADTSFSTAPPDRLAQTGAVTDAGPDSASGTSTSDDTSNGGSTTQTYITSITGVGLVSRGVAAAITSATLTVTLTRGVDLPGATGVDRYTATFVFGTPNGIVTGTSTGEAVLTGGAWRLRGRSTVDGGTWNVASGLGGFRADLAAGATPAPGDDSISWQLDAVVTPRP